MKVQDKQIFVIDFILGHAGNLQLSIFDLKEWINKKYMGAFSDHNNIYDAMNLAKLFLKYKQNNIYEIDEKAIIEYLKDYPKVLKEFKEKRKESIKELK